MQPGALVLQSNIFAAAAAAVVVAFKLSRAAAAANVAVR
jgi:hypothetical protein